MPVFDAVSAMKLRIMKPGADQQHQRQRELERRPAPTQTPRICREPVLPRPPSLSTSCRSRCAPPAAPAPDRRSMPVARQMAARKAKTTPSIVNCIQYGLPTSATAASNSRDADDARAEPEHAADAAPAAGSRPAAAARCASALAPSATRTAISRARVRGARQQQVGDVGAGDQQHEADGAHQRQEHRRGSAPPLKRSLKVRTTPP